MRPLRTWLLLIGATVLAGCRGQTPSVASRLVPSTLGEALARGGLHDVRFDGVDPGEQVVVVGASRDLLPALAAAVGAEVRQTAGATVLWRAPRPRVRWAADDQATAPRRALAGCAPALQPLVARTVADHPEFPFAPPPPGETGRYETSRLNAAQTDWLRRQLGPLKPAQQRAQYHWGRMGGGSTAALHNGNDWQRRADADQYWHHRAVVQALSAPGWPGVDAVEVTGQVVVSTGKFVRGRPSFDYHRRYPDPRGAAGE